MATYYRVGGKSTRYDTLAAANRRASSIFARTGIVASVTEHRTRERGTPPPAAPAPVNDYPKNLAQLKTYLAAGRTVYCSYSLAAKHATGTDGRLRPAEPLAVQVRQGNGIYWEPNTRVWPRIVPGSNGSDLGPFHRWEKAAAYRFTPSGVAYEPAGSSQLWFMRWEADPGTAEEYARHDAERAADGARVLAELDAEERAAAEEIIERQIDAEARERPIGTGDTPREPYRGEYYRAGSLPSTHAAHGAIVHRSPQHAGLFALVYGVKLNPIALVGPYACEQDAADNLAAWGIRLFRRLNAKHAIKADAERGKRMDTHRPGKVADIGRAAVVRRAKLERVK